MLQYILRYPDGSTRRITVPDDAHITFGPAIPFTKKYAGGGEYTTATANTYAVRVYVSKSEKSSLLGVFTGVTEFHRSDITYETVTVGGPTVQAGRVIEDPGLDSEDITAKNTRYVGWGTLTTTDGSTAINGVAGNPLATTPRA